MLLYIHVPFCRAKCRYCAFYSVPLAEGGANAVREYTETLLTEIALWGDRLGKATIESVFFGGGTPSILPPKALSAILDRLNKAFALAKNVEISMEANPESFLAIGYAHEVAGLGVNRLSLGVQSLDEHGLAALGRPHSRREALMAYELARAANFASVSLDLIWGRPGQRRRDWLRELTEAASLSPDHLSCYGLTLEEGTPLAEAHEKGLVSLPEEQDQAAMYMDGAEYLESQGYLQYEISNFARMGFQCRHNLGYWEGLDYIGLGPAATSTFKGLRWTNPADAAAWKSRVRAGLPAHDAEKLTPKIRLLETVMLRLRTTRGLRLKAYHELSGRDFVRDNKDLVRLLHRRGLVRIRNGYLRLTRNGMLVSNAILEHLFDALEGQMHPLMPEKAAARQGDPALRSRDDAPAEKNFPFP
ncbi:MAG: radical SAM family heme chaperone HemW [Deltaproteobacteria bacterium]|jgi:oxygen-independent coproporphyrinogen-3 oxidase|nr:radical SAM family heme chaperone HemW [Deltaproteobacteria bacterium]